MSASALTNEQLQNIKVAYSMGKITTAADGETFEYALASIMMTESSARTHIDGDDGKSLGPMQLQVKTIRWMSKKIPSISWLKTLNDKQIKNYLVSNVLFSSMLAAYYVKMNYNRALKLHLSNPYFRAISKYNGGWNNKVYYKRVKRNMKLVKKLVAEGKI